MLQFVAQQLGSNSIYPFEEICNDVDDDFDYLDIPIDSSQCDISIRFNIFSITDPEHIVHFMDDIDGVSNSSLLCPQMGEISTNDSAEEEPLRANKHVFSITDSSGLTYNYGAQGQSRSNSSGGVHSALVQPDYLAMEGRVGQGAYSARSALKPQPNDVTKVSILGSESKAVDTQKNTSSKKQMFGGNSNGRSKTGHAPGFVCN